MALANELTAQQEPAGKWASRDRFITKIGVFALVFMMGWFSSVVYYKVPKLWNVVGQETSVKTTPPVEHK